jgi:hypothetical protein
MKGAAAVNLRPLFVPAGRKHIFYFIVVVREEIDTFLTSRNKQGPNQPNHHNKKGDTFLTSRNKQGPNHHNKYVGSLAGCIWVFLPPTGMLRSMGAAAVSQLPFHLSYLPFADPARAPLHTYTTTTPQLQPQGASSSGRPPTGMLHSIGAAAVPQLPLHLSNLPFVDPARAPLLTYHNHTTITTTGCVL